MTEQIIKGSIVALVTPFNTDGSVDFNALEKLVNWHIEQGTHGIVATGTTGESPTLNHDEHLAVIKRVADIANGRINVIAGIGSNSTAEVEYLAKETEKNGGCSAFLIVSPYYNKPNQHGLYNHFKQIHDNSNLPIILYNIPSRSVIDIEVETMGRLAKLERIIGVKDATADISRVSLQSLACGSDFIQLSGDDPSAVGFNAQGGVGCISTTANIFPKFCAEIHKHCLNGDYVAAQSLNLRLMKIHKGMFIEPNPAVAKYVLSTRGMLNNVLRAPLYPLSAESQHKVDNLLAELE